jgi:hypothetical protein
MTKKPIPDNTELATVAQVDDAIGFILRCLDVVVDSINVGFKDLHQQRRESDQHLIAGINAALRAVQDRTADAGRASLLNAIDTAVRSGAPIIVNHIPAPATSAIRRTVERDEAGRIVATVDEAVPTK